MRPARAQRSGPHRPRGERSALACDLMSVLTSEPPSDTPTVSILAVDDHPANLLALEAVLAPLGHRMVQATSAMEALRLLTRETFAVILLDVHMPGTDGFETAALIRQHPRYRTT